MTSTLVLLRHGQSEWNQKNIFTGFVDVPLSKNGEDEAKIAGQALKKYNFDAVFTSNLKRAQDTAKIALEGRLPSSYFCSEALNERHYGELQGKNKDEMVALYGKDQVLLWRRSYMLRPPGGESLKDTFDRVIPYYKQYIEPHLKRCENILISAHGNSLRALIKYLEGISDEEIVSLEIPTGRPIVYTIDGDGKILKKEYL